MDKKSTLFQLKSQLILWLLCLAAVGQVLAQQQKSDDENLMVPDSVLKKIKLQDRHINQWFSTTQKRKNVEGSTTIYNEDVMTTPVSDITNVIAGRLPGLYSSKSSGRTGPMFDASSLTLRGQTPLLIIDGVQRSFTSFNVDDIKSITVMNDALSNAMFGLRSGNGVIYITTKDRSIEKPFELGFSAQFGANEQFKRPNFITGADYARLYNEAQQNTFPGATPLYSEERIAALQNGTNDPYTNPNNDWYNTVYKKSNTQQRYAINAAGNGKNYRFYTSVEHFAQDGNFLTNKDNPYNTDNYYKRYNLRTNAQIDFNEDIQLGLNIFGSVENNNEPGVTGSTIMSRIYGTSPLEYPAKNADGSYGGTTSFLTNILASTISSGYIQYNERSLSADVSLKYKLDDITKGLWTKALLSINNYYLQRIARTKSFAIYYPNLSTGEYTKVGSDGVLEAGAGIQSISSQYKQTFFNGLIGYDKAMGNHEFNVLATYNLTNLIDSYTQLNQVYQTAGLKANYSYNEKYLAELALAYSGFNRYAEGNRWGFLPAIGLGWIVSKEEWFNSKAINLLKLRGTIGKSAYADPSNYYTYLQNYSVASTGYNFGATATAVAGALQNSMNNPNITWEKALKIDVGIEAQFLNHFNIALNYYNNKYVDELISPANGYASGIIGLGYPSVNAGKTRYFGYETSLGYQSENDGINYFIKGNLSIAKNKIISRAEGNYPYSWMYRAGQPSATFGYEAIGFYQAGEDFTKTANIPGYTPSAGDIRYNDLNKDGVIDFLDQKAIAGTKPLVFFGLNFGFNYRNFDFNALIEGRVNREIYYASSSFLAFNNNNGNVLDYTTENRWTPQNPVNATLPRLTLGNNTYNTQSSSFWVKRADYIRLKNAEIGYTIPAKLLSKAKISKLRVFVNGYNLLTASKLAYLDPETGLSGFANYRIMNAGVSLKL
ncbi:SusC/RagA family TonB-linked outer membrane protein [Pedobacter insulae]|uniref:TonB-linked outer membrane protein, SusC/RagA family n=1 Tax=Pedobacter insulae TaxID=414048 RepID=A0A1I2VSG1_9SPHI|nr:SusC/RagA family TonB-linked outer membrane protein [Pedobacter insulae]SFG91963.1 TonB-linked outer membrane protein, SusC/RagA family [Pedobacter insulae]